MSVLNSITSLVWRAVYVVLCGAKAKFEVLNKTDKVAQARQEVTEVSGSVWLLVCM